MTLTCVIPAYNEQARIGAVLAAVLDHPLIDDVLVVDDGSTDSTSDVVRRFPKARLITLAQNGGKTAALARGFAETRSEMILLIDADLLGLSPAHLTALITPVAQGRAAMSISLRDNAPSLWRAIGLDYISGERALRRDLLAGQEQALQRLPKFGFEVFLNALVPFGRGATARGEKPAEIGQIRVLDRYLGRHFDAARPDARRATLGVDRPSGADA